MRAFIRATIVCALTLMSAQTIAAQIVDGKDFRTLNPAVETTEDTIEVIDFFAYTCGHCLRLAPLLDEWQKKLPQGNITSEADLQQWLQSHKVNLTEWNKTYQSFSVTMKTQQAFQSWQNYRLDATPYVAVGGKYLTAPHLAGSRQKTIEVLDELIERERQQRKKH